MEVADGMCDAAEAAFDRWYAGYDNGVQDGIAQEQEAAKMVK